MAILWGFSGDRVVKTWHFESKPRHVTPQIDQVLAISNELLTSEWFQDMAHITYPRTYSGQEWQFHIYIDINLVVM